MARAYVETNGERVTLASGRLRSLGETIGVHEMVGSYLMCFAHVEKVVTERGITTWHVWNKDPLELETVTLTEWEG